MKGNMKYSLDDYSDGLCTTKQYREQFNPPAIEVGSVYVQAPGTWYEKHYQILAIDGNVAFAKSTYNKISNKFIGDYSLFNVSDGWTYNDSRDTYRLTREIV